MDLEQLLADLDTDQRTVVETAGLPVGVIAGAGTGKTRTVTRRIAYAAATGQIDPRAMLAVTFTTAAAHEVKQRLESLGVHGVQSRTFHAACLRQAQYFWPQAYNCSLPQIIDNRNELISKVCQWVGLPDHPAIIRELGQEISWTKQTNVLPEEYVDLARQSGRAVSRLNLDEVADAIVAYESLKQASCVIDLDDLLLCTVALLSTHDDVVRKMRSTYRHFVFDEFQDVSPVQARLMQLWVGERDDVMVVGDPAQTIHSFAGARSVYLEHFVSHHRGALGLKLTHNYRSTPQILDVAHRIGPSSLTLVAQRESGAAVDWYGADDSLDESITTAHWLEERHRDGLAWQDMAILFRTRAQAEAIRQILADQAIPFDDHTGDESRLVDKVHLGTLHAAKGREWAAVALCGLNEGTIPHPLSTSPSQLAEERRLLYVGVTRAQSWLRLSWPTKVDDRATPVSRFLEPLV